MEKFNFANATKKLRISFNSKFYESYGYDLFRFDGKSIDNLDDFYEFVVHSRNRGLLIRFYNEYELPYNFFKMDDISDYKEIITYDFLISHQENKAFKHIDFDKSGFIGYLRGYVFLDVSTELIRKFYDGHKAVIVGFYGSDNEGYFFSPLKGYEEFNPKTWTYLLSHHDIKIV
jgi:hypothetical protein